MFFLKYIYFRTFPNINRSEIDQKPIFPLRTGNFMLFQHFRTGFLLSSTWRVFVGFDYRISIHPH